jgi:hypothetical protein
MNEAERLAGYLKGRDAPCPGCGYNLRDLRSMTCPECDEALSVLKIRYHGPRASLASFFFGGVGVLAGMGTMLAVWPRVMTMQTFRPRGPPTIDHLRLIIMVASTLGLVVLAAKWIDWSDEMTKRPARFRWGWAAACFGSVPVVWLVGRLVGRW